MSPTGDPLLDAGIQLILFLQRLADPLTGLMKFFSFLGYEEFFLLVAPAIYWCLSVSAGLRVGLLLMISSSLNTLLKFTFTGPRPYWYDVRVRALSTETSFGLPSGHAQLAVTFWGALAASLGRAWGWAVALAVIFLIGLSRLLLGVHFPFDVLAGWLAGALLLWVYLKLERPVVTWLRRQRLGTALAVAFVASLLLIAPGWLVRASLGAWTLPAAWQELALLAVPDGDPLSPLSVEGLFTTGGAFFGMAAGALLLAAQGGFRTDGEWWRRALRFPIGLLGVVVLWMGLGAVFPDGEQPLALVLRYFRYSLVGLWIAALGPMIFIRLGLAEPMRAPGQQPASARAY